MRPIDLENFKQNVGERAIDVHQLIEVGDFKNAGRPRIMEHNHIIIEIPQMLMLKEIKLLIDFFVVSDVGADRQMLNLGHNEPIAQSFCLIGKSDQVRIDAIISEISPLPLRGLRKIFHLIADTLTPEVYQFRAAAPQMGGPRSGLIL